MEHAQILIVDDNPDVLAVIQAILGNLGHQIHTARDGQSALDLLKLRKVKPDLALLDIQLPGMSGYELCEQMQDHPDWSLIPVVFITGEGESESRFRAFQLGAVGFLNKPVITDLLLVQVNKALEVRRQWTEDFSTPVEEDNLFKLPSSAAQEPLLPEGRHNPPPPPEPLPPEAPLPVVAARPLPAVTDIPMLPIEQLRATGLTAHPHRSGHLAEHLASETQLGEHFIQPIHGRPPLGPQTFAGFVKFFSQQLQLDPEWAWTPETLYERAEQRGIPQDTLAELMSNYTGLPLLEELQPEQVRPGVLPVPFCRRYHVVPFQNGEQSMSFAIPHPFLIEVEDALRRYRASTRYIAPPHMILDLFDGSGVRKQRTGPMLAPHLHDVMDKLHTQYGHEEEIPLNANLQQLAQANAEDAPMIKLVNQLLEEAYEMRASDIHIDPWEDAVAVRYRIDGELRDVHILRPAQLIQPLVARIKIMAQLNIAEKRLPQDGRIAFRQFTRKPLDFDLRVATAPMNFGEKVVMRVIDKQKSTLPLEALGLSKRNLELYRTLIRSPYGMVLHVGPTGSGKSMTLYAALNERSDPSLNVMTAEDPIEYTLPRINQLQVQPAIGLTFARALRAYLRQDPDVILVGEIRDRETAHIAVEAALTGHLLLSTLHTNDAPSTLLRFLEMGIEPFMISPSVVMICAQRLVRKLCTQCREPYTASASELVQLGLPAGTSQTLYRAGGCEACDATGFRGRTGVHELLVPTEDIRQALSEPGMTAERLKRIAVKNGMVTLYWDTMDKVRQGITSVDEALARVMPDEFDSKPPEWA